MVFHHDSIMAVWALDYHDREAAVQKTLDAIEALDNEGESEGRFHWKTDGSRFVPTPTDTALFYRVGGSDDDMRAVKYTHDEAEMIRKRCRRNTGPRTADARAAFANALLKRRN
jgi:hypothetical protein